MTKIQKAPHESWQPSPDMPACDVYRPNPEWEQNQAAQLEDGLFFIVPGLGSIKADYGWMAHELAGRGATVISPNCNQAVRDTEFTHPFDKRAEVVVRAMIAYGAESVRLIPHSIGAPVTVKIREQLKKFGDDAPVIRSISEMQPAAFDNHGIADIPRATRFWLEEAIPRTVSLAPALAGKPSAVYERLDLKQRWQEVLALWRFPVSEMVADIHDAQDSGVMLDYFLGPKDTLTRPEPIRKIVMPIVGEEHVFDIHPNAGHLSAQTHPRRTANAILTQLMSYEHVPLASAA